MPLRDHNCCYSHHGHGYPYQSCGSYHQGCNSIDNNRGFSYHGHSPQSDHFLLFFTFLLTSNPFSFFL